MSRPGPFGHPYCLGFEDIERVVERITRSSESYPPLNVEEPAEGRLRLTLAVAGFASESLSVTLKGRELIVRGERPQTSEDRVFLHKGIAQRGFLRGFVLADGWEVEGALLANGLLRIELKRLPLTQQVRQISITLG